MRTKQLLLSWLFPDNRVALIRGSSGWAGYQSVVLTWEGSSLLLDAPSPWVVRIDRRPVYDHAYVEERRRLARHLPLPRFGIAHDGQVLMEEQIEGGTSLLALSEAEQVAVARELLGRLAGLVRAERERQVGEPGHAAASRHAALLRVVPSLAGVAAAIDTRLPTAPLVSSHGDLKAKNVIVAEQITVVDVTPQSLSLRPFWDDALDLLTASGGNGGLLRALLRGDFERELDELWRAAGLPARSRLSSLELATARLTLSHMGNDARLIGA